MNPRESSGDLGPMHIDGFFSAGKGWGEEIEYIFKGKGTTTHLLIDGNGSPVAFESTAANGDERQNRWSLFFLGFVDAGSAVKSLRKLNQRSSG